MSDEIPVDTRYLDENFPGTPATDEPVETVTDHPVTRPAVDVFSTGYESGIATGYGRGFDTGFERGIHAARPPASAVDGVDWVGLLSSLAVIGVIAYILWADRKRDES